MMKKPRKTQGGALVALLVVSIFVGVVVVIGLRRGGAAAAADPRATFAAAVEESGSGDPAAAPQVSGPMDQEEKAYLDAQHRPTPTGNPILSRVSQMIGRPPVDEEL